ncbi:hypothetical protein SAMN06295974_0332 [Plantibacter flavus]|uniref:Uncharacterized protein n=1 Tax=Plantibacter flavus TaxID=150123 RepID=A0A3N2C0S8_9MICO|nr:hypothetical protein [Plantibacter flavus]ROR81108.1 hypothetical protein EDD42_1159 [Plantibacter flavus]SMG07954.1 hypothetical protein SAMN06295974_0332 [Plantibacter flavus]
MGRQWKAGSKTPVDGKPYAQWKVREVDPPERVKSKHVVPLSSGDEGDVWEYIAVVVFVPIQSEVWVHFAPGTDDDDRRKAWAHAIAMRDTAESFDACSPRELPAQATVYETTIGYRLHGTRCTVSGCQSFGSWHVGPNHSADHVAEDIRAEGYRVRLVLRYGDWVPEVSLSTYRLDTATEVAALANDIAWIQAARRKLLEPQAAVKA